MSFDWSTLLFGSLGSTETYAARTWAWWPAVQPGAVLGLLQVECVRGSKTCTVQYQVEDLGVLPGLMGREFKLTKNGADPVEYLVTLGPLSRCSCMAGQTRGKQAEPCKHLAAMRAIEARGLLGDPMGLLAEPPSGMWFHDEPGEPTMSELSTGGI